MTIQANQGFGVSVFGATGSGGGGTTSPGGSSLQIQYNAAGSFGGMAGTSWDNTNRSLTLTGATVTTSNPVLNLSQTWNAGAVTFKGWVLNVTDTASASASLLMDLQVGGSSKFSVDKTGQVNASTIYANASVALKTGGGASTVFSVDSTNFANFPFGTLVLTSDLYLRRSAAASLQLGAADAAAPVAQTLGVQSVVAGTSNTAGVNFTIKGSAGTGTGAGGSIIFQVAPAGGAGSSQNAFATALTIASNKTATFAGDILGTTGITLATGSNRSVASAGSKMLLGDSSDTYAVAISGAANAGVTLKSAGVLCWTDGTSYGGTADARLYRDADGIIALRGGSTTTGGALSLYTYGASPPAAPAASIVRLYADTSGAKIRLMAIFPSGAAQQIAIEP